MLAALLLAGLVAAPVSSLVLFVPTAQPRRVAGIGPAARRLILALVGTAVVALIALAVLRLLTVPAPRSTTAAAAFAAVSVAWLPVSRRWNARAHLAWAATTFLFAAYL